MFEPAELNQGDILDTVNYSYMICSGIIKAECHNDDNNKQTNHAHDEDEVVISQRDDSDYRDIPEQMQSPNA